MHSYDVWIDIEVRVGNSRTVVCTVFALREFPIRPLQGEHVTFWSAKDSPYSFNVVTVVGVQPHHYASTEIDDVSHHFHPGESETVRSTYLRCRPIEVATTEDARKVVAILSAQHGFEVDPYSTNLLSQGANAG